MEEAIRKNVKRFKYNLFFCWTFGLLCYLILNHYSNCKNCHPSRIKTSVLVPTQDHQYQEQDENELVGCALPSLKPFDPSIRQFLEEPPPVSCTAEFPLVFTTDLNRTLIHHSTSLKENGYSQCCYTPFVRVDETSVKFDDACTPINLAANETEIPVNIEFIRITCLASFLKPHHVDYFAFVPPASILGQKIVNDQENHKKEQKARSGSKVRRPNVVILGLDAVSHMNFQRTMPLAFEYLTKTLKARGMAGFSSNAENTFPNLMPSLTGHTVEEIMASCWKNDKMFFDDCPFIWKNYSSQGYLTAFSEDWTDVGIFRWKKRGFNNTPTDVYQHTLFTEMEAASACHGTGSWCYGPRLGFEILLNLLQKTAVAMTEQNPNSVPYFHFMWATSLFHSVLSAAAHGDQFLLDTLKWFKEQGHLDKDTIFILMSDHGIRWGDIQSTFQGKVERRMPLLYFLFPPWFVQKYPRAVQNLENNAKRLTTHFDLHETMKDLLFLENISDDQIQERQNRENNKESRIPRGISLFLPIPPERTCKDAEIPEVWCVCSGAESLPLENNAMVQKAAENIVAEINKKFAGYPMCANLSVKEVWSAQVHQGEEGRRIKNQNSSDQSKLLKFMTQVEDPRVKTKKNWSQRLSFFISLSASPGLGWFEGVATLETNGSWTTSKEISRADRYSDESYCVEDATLKLFCFCQAAGYQSLSIFLIVVGLNLLLYVFYRRFNYRF